MKPKIAILLLAGACTISAHADFNPVPLTPGSFTADVIVEKTAPKSLSDFTTATMDNVGTNNTANTWYEKGYFTNAPWTGVPPQGSTFISPTDPNHQFKMAPNYAANNALFIANHPGAGLTTGTLTLSSPAAFSSLSVMGSAGNGPMVANYTVHHSGGANESGSISVADWTGGGSTFAYLPNGRVNLGSGGISALSWTNGNSARIQFMDIPLSDAVNPVTSIDFTWVSGGRSALFGLSGSTDNVIYTPITVTGFNRDVIVEATAPKSGYNGGANVTMENPSSGVANAGNGWYEQGFNRGALTTGLPTNGTSYTVGGTRTYTMAPDYTTNCVFFISQNPGTTTATITLNTPISVTGLSFADSAGNGPTVINVTIHHTADPDETTSISVVDWANAATADFSTTQTYVKETLSFNTNTRKIFHNDVAVAGLSPVSSIDLSYASGNRAMIFALSGTTGGNYNPIAVSGYNADGIVERSVPALPLPLTTATTVSMDGGTNNTANTWYEKGYYSYFTNSGFPVAGSTIDSLDKPDHHYQLPASYTTNNAIFVDAAHPTANITIASPATYSALSFLSATANGTVTNQAIMQYADGTRETNTFNSVDWFGQTPVAYYANGRINLNNRTINTDPGNNTPPSNPRLYEAQFALGNVGSPVTNIILNYVGAVNPTTARLVVFAVSATAGAVPPIIASASVTPNAAAYEGTNLIFNAVITGGTAPITYQWQKLVGTNYVNMVNGGNVSGVTTTNMTITGATVADVSSYRLVASNVTGSVNSGILTVSRLVSTLPDVTAPTDPLAIFSGTAGTGAETLTSTINNTIQKCLIFDGDSVAPFVGPVGFTVKPAMGNTIVSALRIYTANDFEGRDPADYVLEGSIDGAAYTTVSSGPLALPAGRNTTATDAINPLTQNLQEVRFTNTVGYSYYRLSFNNVKDNAGSAATQIAEAELLGVLNPNPPPAFTVSPTDVTANEGTTATFTSLAAGPAPLTYQWYDVTAGDPGVALSGETNPNLNLPSVTTGQNANRYRVVATNPNGSVTNPSPVLPGVQLTVNSGAVVISQDLPAELLFYAGRTAQLTVGVSGTAPYYQWQSNGVPLVNGGRILGANSNVLTISNIQLGDATAYQVMTSNSISGPLLSSAASVFVTATPTFHTNGIAWRFVNGGAGVGSYFNAENVLLMTDANGEQRAAWFTVPMNIDGFKASFVYQDVLTGGADGFAFVVQNAPQGTNAIGGGGGGLAYTGITKSAAVMFNIFGTSGISFSTNGNGAAYSPTAPLNLSSGDLIKVDLAYAGSVLSVTLSNTVTASVFATNYTVGSLAATVGTNVALVGITAATGGISAVQQISNFQYIPVPTASAQSVGGLVNLTWPASIGGYGIQSNASLTLPAWSDMGATINQVGGQNQATVQATNAAAFYRLVVVPAP